MSIDPEMMRRLLHLEARKVPVYHVPGPAQPGGYVDGKGYVVAIVIAGDDGFYWTGDMPYNAKRGQRAPLLWGHDIDVARRIADEQNAKAGISREEAALLIARAMARGGVQPGHRRRGDTGQVRRVPFDVVKGGRRCPP
jgi:hypothetical protein